MTSCLHTGDLAAQPPPPQPPQPQPPPPPPQPSTGALPHTYLDGFAADAPFPPLALDPLLHSLPQAPPPPLPAHQHALASQNPVVDLADFAAQRRRHQNPQQQEHNQQQEQHQQPRPQLALLAGCAAEHLRLQQPRYALQELPLGQPQLACCHPPQHQQMLFEPPPSVLAAVLPCGMPPLAAEIALQDPVPLLLHAAPPGAPGGRLLVAENQRAADAASKGLDVAGLAGAAQPSRKQGRKLSADEPSEKRKAQNRAAQRAFRERKENYIKGLEAGIRELQSRGRHRVQLLEEENIRLRVMVEKLASENVQLQESLATLPAAAPHGQSSFTSNSAASDAPTLSDFGGDGNGRESPAESSATCWSPEGAEVDFGASTMVADMLAPTVAFAGGISAAGSPASAPGAAENAARVPPLEDPLFGVRGPALTGAVSPSFDASLAAGADLCGLLYGAAADASNDGMVLCEAHERSAAAETAPDAGYAERLHLLSSSDMAAAAAAARASDLRVLEPAAKLCAESLCPHDEAAVSASIAAGTLVTGEEAWGMIKRHHMIDGFGLDVLCSQLRSKTRFSYAGGPVCDAEEIKAFLERLDRKPDRNGGVYCGGLSTLASLGA